MKYKISLGNISKVIADKRNNKGWKYRYDN